MVMAVAMGFHRVNVSITLCIPPRGCQWDEHELPRLERQGHMNKPPDGGHPSRVCVMLGLDACMGIPAGK